MIIETIYKGICLILKILMPTVLSFFPTIDLTTNFATCLGLILSCCNQANNFLHFILGDLSYILITFAIPLIIYQYVVYPVINFAIGIFENKA